MVAVEFPRKSRGRAVLRISGSATGTVGDGTTAHAVVLLADRGSGNVENLGFLGVNLGGVVPQIPLGVASRDWSQIVEDLDGFARFAVAGFAAAEANSGGGTLTATLTPLEE
jgi:hypothetical protein